MFMGNDFMPHFPTLNIRTFGIDMILSVYKKVLGNRCQKIVVNDKIEWKNVREVVSEIAKMEHENFKKEFNIREKISKRYCQKSYETIEESLNVIPMIERDNELYINPYNYFWQNRYYEELFNIERNDFNIEKISMNYLEGLQWNMIYYTNGCKNWKWTYNYHYPPLFQDLLKHIPIWDVDLVEENKESITEYQQLAYVLPKTALSCLPKKIREKVKDYKEQHDNVEIHWSFCKYFWESHIDFISEDLKEICYLVDTE